MRYRLRTVLIALAIGPPILGWLYLRLVPRPPSPQLIAMAWHLRNFSGGREHPNPTRQRYDFDERADGRALLVDKLTGRRWARDKNGSWHTEP